MRNYIEKGIIILIVLSLCYGVFVLNIKAYATMNSPVLEPTQLETTVKALETRIKHLESNEIDFGQCFDKVSLEMYYDG